MTRDEAVPPPGDLLLQAVEGMERPLFVLDDGWRFRYMNPAGATLLGRDGRRGRRPRHLGEVPGDGRQSLRGATTAGSRPRASRPASRPGSTRCRSGSRWTRSAPTAGLVVTYDDVTERRRTEDERAAAVAAREVAVEAAERAAAEAEESGRHLMLLGDINLAMTSTLDTDEAVQRFADLVVPLLADWCMVSVVDPDGTRRDVGPGAPGPRPGRGHAPLRRPPGRPTTWPTAPVPAAAAQPAAGDLSRSSRRPTSLAMVAGRGGPRGAGAAAAPRPWRRSRSSPAVRSSARSPWSTGPSAGRTPRPSCGRAEIASRRAALALDNARLAAANQQVAERLQLSLLSPPVQPDHLELAVRYRPATQGVSIGGDWYDAFLQPDGDTVLVIGDVMGHDIEAAAAMGQVKTLVRGIAYDRLEEPAGVLRRVDHALVGLAVPTLATALVCRVEQDPADRAAGLRRLRWASAGHPEPDAAARRRHCRRPRRPRRPAARHRLARAAGRRAGARCRRAARCCCSPTGCSSAAACPGRGRAQVREILQRSADLPLTPALRPAARGDARATASRTTSPCSPSGRTRWTPAGPRRPDRSSCRPPLPPAGPTPAGWPVAGPADVGQARVRANAARKPSVVMRPVHACVRSNASGIIVSAIIVRIAPAATAVMTATTCGGAPPSAR